MMSKIESGFIKKQYRSGIENYSDFTKEVGLWESEKHVFQKYLKKEDKILDLGCGTGRTTFALETIGYKKIIGVDLTPAMIQEAIKLNTYFKTNIDFKIGDATKLNFTDSEFDSIVFSFNGLMSIPSQENRDKALREIGRVLKATGFFIFTTHDRDEEAQFLEFWKEEKLRWKNGNQNPVLHEYGDLITKSKNESREIFIHIPNQDEIREWLRINEFKLIETFYRSELFDEIAEVKLKSGECRFWIARNKKKT